MSFSNRNGGSTTPTMLSSLNLDDTDAVESCSNSTSTASNHGLTSLVQEANEDADNAELMNKCSLSEKLTACQTALRSKERMLRRLRVEQEEQLGLLCRYERQISKCTLTK